MATTRAARTALYAADFHHGTDRRLRLRPSSRSHLAGAFTDPAPARQGYAPFNVAALGGKLYVSYAKQDAGQGRRDRRPRARGSSTCYDPAGHLLRRLDQPRAAERAVGHGDRA